MRDGFGYPLGYISILFWTRFQQKFHTICTDAQFVELLNFGVAESILAAAIDSTTAVDFTAVLAALYTSITYSDLVAPCWPCFTELAHAVFNLSEIDLVICKDIFSSDCNDIIGDSVIGFEDCSGSPFILEAVTTTIAPTTVAATSTTAATTAAATTTTAAVTTTAGTTTKSSIFPVYSNGLAVLILLVAL